MVNAQTSRQGGCKGNGSGVRTDCQVTIHTMPYKLLYQGKFSTIETTADTNEDLAVTCTINIYDTESGEGDVEMTIPLDMADNPVLIRTEDDNEDKFSVILPKTAEINVHTSSSIGIETFVFGGDRRYYSEVYITPDGEADILKFNGWLSASDIQEEAQPNPNILTLTATDGLGMLKDDTLTNDDGEVPENEWSIMDLLRWAISRGTGIEREFCVVFNTREEDAPVYDADTAGSGHFFKWCYLDAKTFETDIHETETLDEVVKIILGNKARVTTYDGKVWIYCVDEMLYGQSYYLYRFLADGAYFSRAAINLRKYIGATSPMSWMNDDAVISATRPYSKSVLTFTYEYPKELMCNIDLERGEGAEPTGASNETTEYTPECIDFLREGSSGPDPEDIDFEPWPASEGVLRKRYEFNYEKERYLSALTAGGFRHYFRFSEIFVTEKGRFQLSFDYRFNVDDGTTNCFPAIVRLLGDDGSIWCWRYDAPSGDSYWQELSPTDGWFTVTWEDDLSGLDNTEWRNIGATSPPIPVTGRLCVRLVNGFAPPKEVHFVNIQAEYTAYVNGSYQRYTKQVHTVQQEGASKAIRDEEVRMSDAPDRRIKGAILIRGENLELYTGTMDFAASDFQISGNKSNKFRAGQRIVISGTTSNNIETSIIAVDYHLVGDVTIVQVSGTFTTEAGVTATISLIQFVLAGRFYRGHLLPAGPAAEDLAPYGEVQAFDVWNQVNRVMRNFEGTVDRLQSENNDPDGGIPDLPFGVLLTDADTNTNNKNFMIMHFEQNYHLCEWNVLLSEVHDNIIGKSYEGHTFKYITE